jgi:hypothetical protein
VKVRPILFSAPMVKALLAGTKTQTRRIVKLGDRARSALANAEAPVHEAPGMFRGPTDPRTPGREVDAWNSFSPYGVPGDRLWVRESFCENYFGDAQPGTLKHGYRADWDRDTMRGIAPEPTSGAPCTFFRAAGVTDTLEREGWRVELVRVDDQLVSVRATSTQATLSWLSPADLDYFKTEMMRRHPTPVSAMASTPETLSLAPIASAETQDKGWIAAGLACFATATAGFSVAAAAANAPDIVVVGSLMGIGAAAGIGGYMMMVVADRSTQTQSGGTTIPDLPPGGTDGVPYALPDDDSSTLDGGTGSAPAPASGAPGDSPMGGDPSVPTQGVPAGQVPDPSPNDPGMCKNPGATGTNLVPPIPSLWCEGG